MKNIVTLLLVFLLCSTVMAIDYNVPWADSIPIIDGNLVAGEWDDAFTVVLDTNIVSNGGTVRDFFPDDLADLSATIYVKWDADNLYLAARVYDQSLNWLQDAPGPFNDQDTLQVCFNLLNDPNAQIFEDAAIYDIVPQTADSAGPALYKHDGSLYSLPNASLDGQELADGYIVELSIPWSDFGGYDAVVGDKHGIGFILVDYDNGYETTMFDYQGSITDIAGWNALLLVSENGCGSWGIPYGDINFDCRVNFEDFSLMAADWLNCTDPTDDSCSDARVL